eukprot:GILK01004389.1.p1 GENE.GILK01004389.1~~GILK01004389.1.p1  ORF type:complete len:570 (-),score=171.76 GILK01004389.1:92-1801(-)
MSDSCLQDGDRSADSPLEAAAKVQVYSPEVMRRRDVDVLSMSDSNLLSTFRPMVSEGHLRLPPGSPAVGLRSSRAGSVKSMVSAQSGRSGQTRVTNGQGKQDMWNNAYQQLQAKFRAAVAERNVFEERAKSAEQKEEFLRLKLQATFKRRGAENDANDRVALENEIQRLNQQLLQSEDRFQEEEQRYRERYEAIVELEHILAAKESEVDQLRTLLTAKERQLQMARDAEERATSVRLALEEERQRVQRLEGRLSDEQIELEAAADSLSSELQRIKQLESELKQYRSSTLETSTQKESQLNDREKVLEEEHQRLVQLRIKHEQTEQMQKQKEEEMNRRESNLLIQEVTWSEKTVALDKRLQDVSRREEQLRRMSILIDQTSETLREKEETVLSFLSSRDTSVQPIRDEAQPETQSESSQRIESLLIQVSLLQEKLKQSEDVISRLEQQQKQTMESTSMSKAWSTAAEVQSGQLPVLLQLLQENEQKVAFLQKWDTIHKSTQHEWRTRQMKESLSRFVCANDRKDNGQTVTSVSEALVLSRRVEELTRECARYKALAEESHENWMADSPVR